MTEEEEIRRIVESRDHQGARNYLESKGIDPRMIEFVFAPRSPREGKRLPGTDANLHRLAEAKALYKQLRRADVSVHEAKAEVKRRFPMLHTETINELTRGGFDSRIFRHFKIAGEP